MKKLRNNKIRKLLAFMVALALMVSCMPSAYTISASEAFGDGTEDIFTDGEITSEPAAEESTPDVSSADQEETEQAQQSTLTYENDSVKVTAEALEDGALPQNTALKADGVNENSSVSYDTVSQKLSAAATDKGSSLRGFFAYDVYFADGDGNRVEPNGRVRVTFEYKTPAAPELTDAASTSVTVEKLHYNSSTGDTDVNTLQANEDLKVLNVNEGKQIQTLQVETGNAAVFAVMWDSPETADVEAEAVSGNGDEVSIASEELTDGTDISDEPEQDAAQTPAAENPEVTPDAEPSEAPAENPDAEPTEAPAENPDVVEEPAEDIASPDEVPAADENGETSLIEVQGDDTNLRVSPSIEAEVLATVNAGTQLTLLDTVTAEDGATWYKVSWEGTEAYIRSDMAQVVDSSDEAEEPEDVLESEEVSYSQEVGNVVVTATAAKGVIPEGAQFVVTPIEKGSDQYADIEKQLHEGAENESYTVAGFLAYDISFLNDDGTKIEAQNGSVRVSIAYKEAEIPEDVAETDTAQENMNVSLVHFVEDANGNVTEVVNMSNDGQAEVSTTDNGEIESANFETESFSTFSVVWLADDFTSVQTTSSYGVEETVDSAKRGITINMFNYDTAGINEGHSLKFSNGSDGGNEDYNKYRGPSDLSLGIMQKRLGEDSYPIVDKGKKESSSYLFSTKEGTGKEFYSDANYLFKQDADGYYEYDSTKNFAQFNKNTKEFTVYKVPGSSKDPIDLQQGSKHGSFFPFNTLGDHKYWGIPQISEKSPDFHFGMTMSAKFIQPKDGKINGNNMVFEFSGDDDVWVYIDGVLVLDIGGIHNSVSGSIDFAEGTVKVGSNNYTLKNLFKEAGAEKEGDFVSRKDIFKDYTVHTINFYYLERGKGDSNCKLKFNLPTVPDGSVKVQKQLSNTDKEKYADVKFKFQLLVKDEKENYVPSTPNGILDDGRKVEFSEDKVFTLKPGQYATFSGLKANTKYRIKELGVSKNEYDKVFINDEVTTSQDGNVISNEATVGSRPWVIFTNKCSEKNSRKLCITKKIKGDIPVNDKFDFEIKLNGQKYTGNYYLQDSEGNYYTSENGPLKKAKNKTVCGSAVNGVVSSVPAGYTVVLEQILAGTSFEVNEINLNPTDYGNPEYSIEAAEDVNTTDKASGKIELGSDAKVTVTNTRNNVASLEITKVNTSNQSLPGAKFTLTLDGDSAKTYNVTSDENGLLKFENLSVGTYTLTETEAPSGYVKSTESYKVKVSVENNKATAKLYKADGTNEIENKQIINYTEKEEAENNLTSSKTAKVVDYENRIYKINLNAETTGREGDVEAQGASVVMVLDASDSMNDSIANTNTSKLVALQNAANTFIDTLKSKSPESEIAIIWYSGSEGGNTSITNSKFKQLNNNEDVSSLKRTIDNKDASGGTPMGVALATARNQLSSAKHEKNKYVVFMTDGLPGHNNNDNWNCMVANNAVNNANSIKEQATLYTVGVGLNDAGSFNWKLGHSSTSSNSGHGYKYEYYRHKSITGSEFLSQYIATKSSDGTKKYAYDTSGLNDLVNTFNVIAGSIGDLFTVQPKEIVDVIDARFKLTDDGLNDLATNSRLGTGKIKTNNDGSKEIIWTDSTTGSVVGKVTIVERGDGTTKITWKEQAARIGNAATENENDKGWNASFRIQAKDDFIGGNMIPTNGADSGIYLDGGGIKKFEQPSVNVKLLSLSIGNDTTTVFKGDPINTRNYGNVLAETIAVVELNGSTKTLTAVNPQDNGKVKLPELTKDQISNLSTDKVLIIGDNPDNLPYKYTYPGSNEAVGYFTYTYTLAKGDNADNHVATAVGNEVEKYKLTVTYYPYSKSDRSTILSGTGVQQPDAEKGGTQVNSNLEATGNYVVNVVAGSIQIIKKLDVVAEQDETFNFTITDEKNRTVATATATIKKDEPTATAVFTLAEGIDAKLESDNTKLSELSRGDYKVVESLGADVHYELQEIATVDGTNCHSVIARDQQQKATDITFTMGTDTDNKVVLRDGNNDVTNGQIGIAKFTNKKIVVDIELEKVDSQTTDTKLSGAEFALYKVDTSGNEIQVNSYTSEQRGKISIKNLPIGQYVLRETKAPTGYVKSAEPWNITVANDRTITVKYDGKDVASKPDNNKTIYQITNTKVYSLPESGGPGTYGFTISGVAILATALLLFINNKRREEEAKRS
ncbi:SpaA isopeptide-forming pilin-related protein [Blautia massiliensis (ex Durand et al. 2017)]|uniref:SpaA isopeptide-forming pilin-related protein n=1 Tax=Blautia massiliensis (ex Durand et al. 2017) TaxID=1737424 RepID=UPI00073E3925|nr:SpaA isopeptide-forming pilin-related protein [Blautia massiliensis (ex Durand et al. 2017)]